MKAKIRIPTDQYAFIEVDFEGEPEEIVNEHNQLLALTKKTGGLDATRWRVLLDRYLTNKTMTADEYAELNEVQMFCIQELKKAFKRFDYKDTK